MTTERTMYAAMPLCEMEPARLRWTGEKYALENMIRHMRQELQRVNGQIDFLKTERERLESGELVEPPAEDK